MGTNEVIVMKQLTFHEAFRPTADDIGRGDGYYKISVQPVDYPEFGLNSLFKPITNINEFMIAQRNQFAQKYIQGEQIKRKQNEPKLDYQHVRKIWSGKYGSVVCIVRQMDSGIYYVRKAITKSHLVRLKKVDQIKNVKRILDAIRFPFSIHLKYFYTDNSYLYFILPLVAGGSVFHYLKTNRRLHERITKFIASQVLLAVEYFHLIGLIHRDLKLENILIDHEGYIKIANFDMSKLIQNNRTYTICGTAEYMAPEVITHKGYGLAADWWSFGVLIYELCNGSTPFFADETVQVFTLIVHCDYAMPVHFSLTLKDLITKLLQPDPTKRYGNLRRGVNDIKGHYWFRDVPWLSVINKKIISPMIPFVSDENNRSFFDITPEPSMIIDKTDTFAAEFTNF